MLIRPFVRLFMKLLPLRGEAILGPDLLVVNEGTLPGAIQEMLERGEGDGLGRSGHRIQD